MCGVVELEKTISSLDKLAHSSQFTLSKYVTVCGFCALRKGKYISASLLDLAFGTGVKYVGDSITSYIKINTYCAGVTLLVLFLSHCVFSVIRYLMFIFN